MCIHSIGCIYCLQLVRGMPTLYLNRPKLPIVPHNLLRKIILSQLKCLCTYVNSLDYHSFIVSFEVSYYGSSNFFFFSKIVFLRTLHINFIISLSISTKKKKISCQDSEWDHWIGQFDWKKKKWHLNNNESSNP